MSLGIEPSVDQLLEQVERFLDEGYRRIKLKIAPGWDVAALEAVRSRFGDVPLQVDANGGYRRADLAQLRELDRYDLLMIEQPFAPDDLLAHAELQRGLRTPICLDESIESHAVLETALQLDAARVDQHQGVPSRRARSRAAGARHLLRQGRARVVRRDARVRRRQGGERGARRAARILVAERHLRFGQVLPRGRRGAIDHCGQRVGAGALRPSRTRARRGERGRRAALHPPRHSDVRGRATRRTAERFSYPDDRTDRTCASSSPPTWKASPASPSPTTSRPARRGGHTTASSSPVTSTRRSADSSTRVRARCS